MTEVRKKLNKDTRIQNSEFRAMIYSFVEQNNYDVEIEDGVHKFLCYKK